MGDITLHDYKALVFIKIFHVYHKRFIVSLISKVSDWNHT